MNIPSPARMTVDQYLAWALDRPGRYELHDGVVVRMSPERALHAQVKAACYVALRSAVKRARASCFVMPDGMTVRIGERTAFEPDALVYAGPRLADEDIEVPNAVIVVEVLSPGTRGKDTGAKLAGYFAVPSIAHNLIVDADERTVVHHRRQGGAIATEIRREGALQLDPPGIEFPVADFFATD